MEGEQVTAKISEGAEFIAYAIGMVCASVCTTLTDHSEIAERMNAHHPTGIRSDWHVSDETTFADGSPMPNVCADDPARKHWLLTC